MDPTRGTDFHACGNFQWTDRFLGLLIMWQWSGIGGMSDPYANGNRSKILPIIDSYVDRKTTFWPYFWSKLGAEMAAMFVHLSNICASEQRILSQIFFEWVIQSATPLWLHLQNFHLLQHYIKHYSSRFRALLSVANILLRRATRALPAPYAVRNLGLLNRLVSCWSTQY